MSVFIVNYVVQRTNLIKILKRVNKRKVKRPKAFSSSPSSSFVIIGDYLMPSPDMSDSDVCCDSPGIRLAARPATDTIGR